MLTLLLSVHVLICVSLIGLILLQRGKGADMGSSLGAGASQTVFGSQGSHDFLSRATYWLAAGFFVICLMLTIAGHRTQLHWSDYVTAPTTSDVVAPAGPNLPE